MELGNGKHEPRIVHCLRFVIQKAQDTSETELRRRLKSTIRNKKTMAQSKSKSGTKEM